MNEFIYTILEKEEEIIEMICKGASNCDIAKFYNVPNSTIYNILYDCKNINNNNLDSLLTCKKKDLDNIVNKYGCEKIKDLYMKVLRIWECEETRIKKVEQALFNACFDHKVAYKTMNKAGMEIQVEQVIPASYNAQRFYLINRHPKKWANENKDITINKDKPIQQIAVKFIDPDNEPSQKRVKQMMEEIEKESKENGEH